MKNIWIAQFGLKSLGEGKKKTQIWVGMKTEVGLKSIGRVNMIKTHTQFSKDL